MKCFAHALILAGAALTLGTGCASDGDKGVHHVPPPDFDYAKYQRVAILAAECSRPDYADVGQTVSSKIASRLQESGKFKVYDRDHLKQVLDEQELGEILGMKADARIQPGQIKSVQALVIPEISGKEMHAGRATVSGGGYGRSGGGGGQMDVFEHSATVTGSVKFIDTRTGESILIVGPEAVHRFINGAVMPPSISPENLAQEAARYLGDSLASGIVPLADWTAK